MWVYFLIRSLLRGMFEVISCLIRSYAILKKADRPLKILSLTVSFCFWAYSIDPKNSIVCLWIIKELPQECVWKLSQSSVWFSLPRLWVAFVGLIVFVEVPGESKQRYVLCVAHRHKNSKESCPLSSWVQDKRLRLEFPCACHFYHIAAQTSNTLII